MIQRFIKKSCSLVLAVAMVASLSVNAFASAPALQKDSSRKTLKAAYEQVMSYASQNKIELGMRYDDFVSNYEGQPIKDYLNAYYSVLRPEAEGLQSSAGSGSAASMRQRPGKAVRSQTGLLSGMGRMSGNALSEQGIRIPSPARKLWSCECSTCLTR